MLSTLWYHASLPGKCSNGWIPWWWIKPTSCVYSPVRCLFDFGHRKTHKNTSSSGRDYLNLRIKDVWRICEWKSQAPMINHVLYQILPPEEFDLFKPTKWIKLIGPLKQFHSASGLSKRDEESQVNMLLYIFYEKQKVVIYWLHKALQPIQRDITW